jgi:hypothetical protein
MFRSAGVLLLVTTLISGCTTFDSKPTPSPDAMPNSPLDLPSVAADLTFSGPVNGHLSSVRLFDCKVYPAGTAESFRSSVLFQIGEQWYRLTVLTSGDPVLRFVTPSPKAPNVPGRYRGVALLDEQFVGPGGMALGDHAWGGNYNAVITIGSNPKTVSLATVKDPAKPSRDPVVVVDGVDLEARDPNYTAPGPTPAPPEQTVHLKGTWSCEPGTSVASSRPS